MENLLLDENKNIKIIDFGLSNNLGKNGLLGTYILLRIQIY